MKIDWFHTCIFHIENDNLGKKRNSRKIPITRYPPVMGVEPVTGLVAVFPEFTVETHVALMEKTL